MKRKDLNILKDKTKIELEKMADDFVLQIDKAKLQQKMKKEKNTNFVKNLKISLAQILSIKQLKEVR